MKHNALSAIFWSLLKANDWQELSLFEKGTKNDQRHLELKQYKNDSIQTKELLDIRLQRFSISYALSEKVRQLQR